MSVLNTAHLTSKITDQEGNKVEVSNKSNILRTDNVNSDIVITKSAVKNWVIPKEKITLTTTIVNNMTTNISNMVVFATIGNGATFVEGSVKIGTVDYPNYNIETGFTPSVTIGALGGEMEITYDLEIEEYPEVNDVTCSTTIGFTLDSKQYELSSNDLKLEILENEIVLLKTADAKAVKTGDVLTYTIEISNSGNLKNTELFFTDPIPDGTTFVDGSVTVDDVAHADYNPETGFDLDDLDVNKTITVKFKVQVD